MYTFWSDNVSYKVIWLMNRVIFLIDTFSVLLVYMENCQKDIPTDDEV